MQFCSRKREIAVECGFCRGPLCLIHVALDAFECSENGDRGVAAVADGFGDLQIAAGDSAGGPDALDAGFTILVDSYKPAFLLQPKFIRESRASGRTQGQE